MVRVPGEGMEESFDTTLWSLMPKSILEKPLKGVSPCIGIPLRAIFLGNE